MTNARGHSLSNQVMGNKGYKYNILDVQLCFRRFPIDGFSGKW